MLQRRAVLAAFGSAMAAAMAPFGVLAGTNLSRRNQLSELMGCSFHIADPSGEKTTARLVALDDGPRCPGLEQFSVVFEGADLCEGLHEVYHHDTGRFLISLMPSGESGSRQIRKRAFFSTFV
jgi:hypothetical protein